MVPIYRQGAYTVFGSKTASRMHSQLISSSSPTNSPAQLTVGVDVSPVHLVLSLSTHS